MKTSKKLLMLGATLSLSALLFGCSKEEAKEVLPAEEPKEIVRQVPKSEGEDVETTTDSESEATSAVENSELKETFTLTEEQIKEKGLELIKADYEKFLAGKTAREALYDTYHSSFTDQDREVELPKLESNLEAALEGKKVDDIKWSGVDTSIMEVTKSPEDADPKGIYGLVTSSMLSSEDGSMYHDQRYYYVKEFNNELHLVYLQGLHPAEKQ